MERKSNSNVCEDLQPSRCEHICGHSSNVSAAFNTDLRSHSTNESESNLAPSKTRRTMLVSNHCSYSRKRPKKKVTRKYSCEECYCRKFPVQPKLTMKSTDEGGEAFDDLKWELLRKMCRNCTPSRNFSRFTRSCSPASCKCGCSSANRALRGINCCSWCPRCITCMRQCCCCLPHLNCKSSKHYSPCRQHITPRAMYEKPKSSEEMVEEYERTFADSLEAQCSSNSQSRRNEASLASLIKNTNNLPDFTFFKSTTDVRANLQKLNTFRKENYFDCFAADLCQDPHYPDHKCVHKFALDNRLIPQPLHADPCGISRCVICNKAKRSDTALGKANALGVIKNQKGSDLTLKNSRGFSESRIPNQINITGKNDRIEIKIPLNFNKLMDLFATSGRFQIKNPAPRNSVALRLQKGVV